MKASVSRRRRRPGCTVPRRSLMGQLLAYERVEGVWGNREVPLQHRRRGHVGETWFSPRERAEGERRSLALEAVPDASHRRDPLRVPGVVLDLGPEALHGHVDEARVAQEFVVPDELEEELELGRGQLEILAALAGAEAGRIDLEVVHGDDGIARDVRGPAERRPCSRDELGHLEGLRHVVVRAQLEADDDVDRVALRREDHDRHPAVLADLAAHLVAVERRQHEVEDDEIERLLAEVEQGRAAVAGGRHAEAGVAQAQLGDLADGGVVLDEEHAFVHRYPTSWGRTPWMRARRKPRPMTPRAPRRTRRMPVRSVPGECAANTKLPRLHATRRLRVRSIGWSTCGWAPSTT